MCRKAISFSGHLSTLRVLLALLPLAWGTGCAFRGQVTGDAPHWYRGNTHTHTVLCGHADSTPEVVTAWYHERGYNFLILSEHNRFIDPATVALPENPRKDFILVPGEEITGAKTIHTTAMNITNLVAWKFNSPVTSEIIQNHVDGTRAAGGHAILNHPNFKYAASGKDIRPVKGLHMFELFNGHPHVHNDGNADHPDTEAMWDALLTDGMLMYGVSSDDAHHFQTYSPKKSNPGRGWVMVAADALNSDALTAAMRRGDFYASNGVFLQTYTAGPGRYHVVVDHARTQQELVASPDLRGHHVTSGTEGYRITFIGPEGKVLESVTGQAGRYEITDEHAYVRAKVTFTRKHPAGDGFEEYYAWGQPVFTDGRGE